MRTARWPSAAPRRKSEAVGTSTRSEHADVIPRGAEGPRPGAFPIARGHLRRFLQQIVDGGASFAAVWPSGEAEDGPIATLSGGRYRRPRAAVETSAQAVVHGAEVATVRATCSRRAFPSVSRAVRVAADRIADLWTTNLELDSMAGEIVHNYEELHLLYEVGKLLTSQLSLDDAAGIVLRHIERALGAARVTLTLEAPREAIFATSSMGSADLGADGPGRDEHGHIQTTLFSGGQVLGTLAVGRAPGSPAFSSDDIKLLEGVGTLVGNAIRNAQLWDELRMRAEAQRQSELYLRAVLNNVADGIVTLDSLGIIETCNPAAERIFGYAGHEMQGMDIRALMPGLQVSPADAGGAGAHGSLWSVMGEQLETAGRRRDGTTFPLEVAISVMRAESRRLFVLTARDLTERKRFSAVEHQALHDPLTGLPNRTLLHDRLHHGLALARRDATPLAFLVVDLDRFKEVNDTLGHHHGDLVLQAVGQRLERQVRESDTIARWGGDEFAAVLMSTGLEGATTAALKLQASLEEPFCLDGHVLSVGASIGIALSPDHGLDANTLIRRADVAMYIAKRTRSKYALFRSDGDRHRQIPRSGDVTADVIKQA